MKVYRYYQYFGRQGTLSGLFIAQESHVEWLKSLDFNIVAYEELGKHSQPCIDTGKIEMVSDSEEVVKFVKDYLGGSFGIDPFDYVEDEYYDWLETQE